MPKPMEREKYLYHGQSRITVCLAILVGVTRHANSDKIIKLASLDDRRNNNSGIIIPRGIVIGFSSDS